MNDDCRSLRLGDVLVVALPSRFPAGHEQSGVRPAVVVAVPKGPLRFPVVVAVPLTTRAGQWAVENPSVYIKLGAGAGGLPADSVALLDQIGSIDAERIQGYLGSLNAADSARVFSSLAHMFGLFA